MAPVTYNDLSLSSLELDDLTTRARNILHPRDFSSPKLVARADPNYIPGAGARDPSTINNAGFIALFALIGASMVLASIWFFFWAKNGGFHFQETDWDDYKSTVLRRKGPDGRTLSNATKSTKLGGSTIAGTQYYKWQKQAARSVVGRDEKGRKGILGKRGWAGTHSVTYSDDFTDTLASRTVADIAEMREAPDYTHHSSRYRDRDVQDYKKERPARVGGLNKVPDGSHFDTDRSETMTETSDQPILSRQKRQDKARERAERQAREEAARMERRWKKEAEEAAAALARENTRPPPPPAHAPKRSPAVQKQRGSRPESPKKRAPAHAASDSDAQSTAYTQSTSNRTASYYDAYRPQPSAPQRQSSPSKPAANKSRMPGGYRRGADDEL